MAKMKTVKSAAKRFKVTASGKVKRQRAGAGHLMRRKTSKRKRSLRRGGLVQRTERQQIKQLIPYG